MHRTPRARLLSVVALGSLTTAAAATPPTTMPFDDQMAGMHDQGVSVDEMHGALAEQGIDVDEMQADCPMLTGSMANMHGNGGDHHGHHDTPGR